MKRTALLLAAMTLGCGGDGSGRLAQDQKVIVQHPEKTLVFFGMEGEHALEPVQVGSACIVVADTDESDGKDRPVTVRTEEANPRIGRLARSYLRPAKR